jgi:hypothetical protein
VRVRHLASHLLGRIVRRISTDWMAVYHHPLYLLETFVDTERLRGVSQCLTWPSPPLCEQSLAVS